MNQVGQDKASLIDWEQQQREKETRMNNETNSLMPISEIVGRIQNTGVRPSTFARFVTEEMPNIRPGLKNFKSLGSAKQTLSRLDRDPDAGTHGWTHILLDASVREWDQTQVTRLGVIPEEAEKINSVPPELEALDKALIALIGRVEKIESRVDGLNWRRLLDRLVG